MILTLQEERILAYTHYAAGEQAVRMKVGPETESPTGSLNTGTRSDYLLRESFDQRRTPSVARTPNSDAPLFYPLP